MSSNNYFVLFLKKIFTYIAIGGLGSGGICCCLFTVLLNGLVSTCWLLCILNDAGGVRRACFVVWKCELAWLAGFVGIWLLLSAVIDCRGSVLIEMSLVLLVDGLQSQ